MKTPVLGSSFEGTQEAVLRTYTPYGPNTLRVSWALESTSAPTHIHVTRELPDSWLPPEHYATWQGFAQAYGLRVAWGDV